MLIPFLRHTSIIHFLLTISISAWIADRATCSKLGNYRLVYAITQFAVLESKAYNFRVSAVATKLFDIVLLQYYAILHILYITHNVCIKTFNLFLPHPTYLLFPTVNKMPSWFHCLTEGQWGHDSRLLRAWVPTTKLKVWVPPSPVADIGLHHCPIMLSIPQASGKQEASQIEHQRRELPVKYTCVCNICDRIWENPPKRGKQFFSVSPGKALWVDFFRKNFYGRNG